MTAYFTVAFSTQVSAVSGSRLCVGPNSSLGESTTYTIIPFTYEKSKGSGTIPLSPTGQQAGWVCTYTIKVTDSLSQTTTWLGSVELSVTARPHPPRSSILHCGHAGFLKRNPTLSLAHLSQ